MVCSEYFQELTSSLRGGRGVVQLIFRFLTSVSLWVVTDVSYKHATPCSVYLDVVSSALKMEAACSTATSMPTLKPTYRQNLDIYVLKCNVDTYYCISLFIYARSVNIRACSTERPTFVLELMYATKNTVRIISDSYVILSEWMTNKNYQLPRLLINMFLLIFTYYDN
jgi:hypothetical protein